MPALRDGRILAAPLTLRKILEGSLAGGGIGGAIDSAQRLRDALRSFQDAKSHCRIRNGAALDRPPRNAPAGSAESGNGILRRGRVGLPGWDVLRRRLLHRSAKAASQARSILAQPDHRKSPATAPQRREASGAKSIPRGIAEMNGKPAETIPQPVAERGGDSRRLVGREDQMFG